jgi:glyoxylase-like metal-dependent hydrolase (beta-lactamase superfamily II)
VSPGDTLSLADLQWQVLDVSGHSPGGVAYYCRAAGVVFAGDALFAGSIGRYDFPGSSRERLLKNIQEHLLTLPDKTVLYSGHGPTSTIGHEREHNWVLQMELGA